MLNLTGDQQLTGKSVGSDIREEKKTLAYVTLMNALSEQDKQKLKETPSVDERVHKILELMKSHNILDQVRSYGDSLEQNAKESIAQLNMSPDSKQKLLELLSFVKERKS